MPYSDRYITLVRVGRIVTACAYITLTSNFNQTGNTSVNETIPKGFRPSGDSRAVMRGTDNSGAASFYLYGTADGKMVLNGTGYTSRFVGISGCWITAQLSLTQPLLYAKFKWQDTKSFQPDAYGGGMQIVVDERNRLLHVDLSGFKSTVNLSHDYPVFQYASGVKPSKAVSLGCLWALPVGNWAKQATWNANGTIMVVGGLSNGDRCMHTPRTLPIPDGVTFS